AQNSFQKIIAIGGDGTVHEIANGILQSQKNITLGLIPVGTGNDLAAAYKIGYDIKKNIELIVSDKIFYQDVIEIKSPNLKTDQYVISMMGFGFDADVAGNVNGYKQKGSSGKLVYILSAVKTIFKYEPVEVKIIHDEKETSYKILTMAAGIHRTNGGGIIQCPDAMPDDGFMNVTLIAPLNLWDVITILPKLFSGKIYNHKKVKHFISKQITISGIGVSAEADGEEVCQLPVTLQVLPKALKVLSNR
ncbi:MAG: YegS/Rv2252/BmrU family lipid kinase, partial [Ignavibacteria bacterium]|nr:YegS/Rv2252/BmrU family lipid kinase [Ignavibacteria bacterium]